MSSCHWRSVSVRWLQAGGNYLCKYVKVLSLQHVCLAANWYIFIFLRRVEILTFYLTDTWVKCHLTIWKLICSVVVVTGLVLFTLETQTRIYKYRGGREEGGAGGKGRIKQKSKLKRLFQQMLKQPLAVLFQLGYKTYVLRLSWKWIIIRQYVNVWMILYLLHTRLNSGVESGKRVGS